MHAFQPRPHGIAAALAALVAAAIATLASPAPSCAEELIDKELSKYWNAEIAVPALNNPLFERKGGVEGVVRYGMIPNDNFYLFQTVGGSVGFYLTDSIAIGGDFSYLMASESKILHFLGHVPAGQGKEASLTIGAQKAPLLKWIGGLAATYTPFHGKLGIFDKKVSSFDVNFSLGASFLNADIDESLGNKPAVNMIKVGGNWGIGMRFFLTRFLNLHVDYRQHLYSPQKSGETTILLAPVEFSVGLAFLSK